MAKMITFLRALISLIVIYISSTCHAAACPCKDASLCNNIKINYTKELYGFIGGGHSQYNDTSQYNWTYTTAFAVNHANTNMTGMNETMCTAHSHGVRMILWGYPGMPFTNDNETQMNWIKNLFNLVKYLNYDGVTFDYEGTMLWNDPKDAQYVSLVNRTTQYFHENLPGSTISVCVAFQAYLQWGRQYDYYWLAQASDYLYIMGYDTNGQIWDGQCIARAVSPIMNIQRGVQSYLNLGIDPFKLILGIPWYGKINQCIMDEMDGGITGKFCPIVPKDNKGVNCSNGGWHANPEQSYAEIMSIDCNGKNNVTEIRWD